MISQTAEYALRAVVYLAEQGEPQTIQQIARATRVPGGYLSKVMQGLARQRIVSSQRGLGGGFTLIAPTDSLTIYDVVQAVDPLPRIDRCPLDLPAHQYQLCELHSRLNRAHRMIEELFREASIDSLIKRPTFSGSPTAVPLPLAPTRSGETESST